MKRTATILGVLTALAVPSVAAAGNHHPALANKPLVAHKVQTAKSLRVVAARVTTQRVTNLRATNLRATNLRATNLRAMNLRAMNLRAMNLSVRPLGTKIIPFRRVR